MSIGKLPDIRDGEEEACYGGQSPEERWSTERKYDVVIDEVLGEKRFQLGAVLNGLILLNWKRDGGPFMIRRIEIKKHTNLLSAFIKAPDSSLYREKPTTSTISCPRATSRF